MPLTLAIRDVLPATVRSRIVHLALEGRPFDFAPGQAVLVSGHGDGKSRPYSMASAPEDVRRDGWLELLVGVDERGQARGNLPLEPGVRVDVDGPVGTFTFPPAPNERRFLFIAGGTGIAPLRAMLRHAMAVPHRELGLFYSARTPEEFAYQEEFATLAREGRIELLQTVTRATEDHPWAGARGRIGHADLRPLLHDPATLCFVCGPPPLVAEITTTLRTLGIEKPRIRVEEWGQPLGGS